tara:strand:- start:511 stop:1017 length:507 start_codon:yes stop_codon:yes gene_type:complete
MALTKVNTGGIAADAVDNTILKLDDNYAFTGTVTGAGPATEEGSWTPSLTGVSSHSVAVGRYVKIGKMVTAHAHVNGVVSGSGSMTVSGLPYSSNSTTNMQQSMTVGFNSHVFYSSGSMEGVQARINPDATEFSLLRYRHGNNGDGLQASQQSGTAVTILIGGTYMTD